MIVGKVIVIAFASILYLTVVLGGIFAMNHFRGKI